MKRVRCFGGLFSLVLLTAGGTASAGAPPVLVTQAGHSSTTELVHDIDLSPDGQLALTGAMEVKIWEMATGRELATLKGGRGRFTPDGKAVIIGARDYTQGGLRRLEVGTWRELWKVEDVPPSPLELSPDGTRLYTQTAIYDARSGKRLRELQANNKATLLRLAPDGRTFLGVEGTDASRVFAIFDAMTGKLLRRLAPAKYHVLAITPAVSPDGRRALVGLDERAKEIHLLDLETGAMTTTLTSRTKPFRAAVFLPDGKRAVTLHDDGMILWEVATQQVLRSWPEVSDVSTTCRSFLDISRDGSRLLVGMAQHALIFDVASGQQVGTLGSTWRQAPIERPAPAFNADGSAFVLLLPRWISGLGSDNYPSPAWDLRTGRYMSVIPVREPKLESSSAPWVSCRQKALAAGAPALIDLVGNISNQIACSRDQRYEAVTSGTLDAKQAWLVDLQAKRVLLTMDLANDPQARLLAWGRNPNLGSERTYDSFSGLHFTADSRRLLLSSTIGGKSGLRWFDLPDAVDNQLPVLSDIKSWFVQVTGGGAAPIVIGTASIKSKSVTAAFDASSGKLTGSLRVESCFPHYASFDGKLLACVGPLETSGIKLVDVDTGRQLLSLPAQDHAIHQVSFSPDGRFLVTIGADVRVWDVKSGKHLVTIVVFSPNDDGSYPWVAVTPDGRFDGSQDAFTRLHWVQDNHSVPLEAFFETAYTPGLLAEVFGGQGSSTVTRGPDFSKGLRLPPSVRIVAPTSGESTSTESVTVTVEATDQGGGVGPVRLYLNNKLVLDEQRGVQRVRAPAGAGATARRELSVVLAPGVNELRAIAQSDTLVDSTPAIAQITLQRPSAQVELYVLAVGINSYANSKYNLSYSRTDAEGFVTALTASASRLFAGVHKKTIFDGEATRAAIDAALTAMAAQARPQDLFVFYYAGHGVMSEGSSEQAPQFYLVPTDVTQMYGADEMLASKALAADDLRQASQRILAQKQLFIIDACQSGGAVASFASRGVLEEKAMAQLARSAGITVLAATSSEQSASEAQALGHGLFTYALIEALRGPPKAATPKLTVKALEAYLNERVPELTQHYRGAVQYPNSFSRGQDFPIALF